MDKKNCRGCEDNFYNGTGAAECWHLKGATIVPRYRIGTWTQPTQPGAFTAVKVPSCYRQKGEHFFNALPDFVKLDEVNKQ